MPKTTHISKKQSSRQYSLRAIGDFLLRHKYHCVALLFVLAWCVPYVTTSNRIELGDFSFFAQAYEAIRVSIIEYHQFPWWNPWMGGGFPLYANPQMGVFSIQTILVLLFGAVSGLKISIIFYTIAGYFSMFLLLSRYFKIRSLISIPLSVAWLFSTFFVAHLPSHYTFVWYMLIPLYLYLSLTVKSWKSGALLGLAFAVMALSAVHNPFFQIGLVCAIIIIVRLVIALIQKSKQSAIGICTSAITAAGVLAVIAGHRMFLCYQTVLSMNRETPSDPPIHIHNAPYAVFMPFDRDAYLGGAAYPEGPFSWGEVTSSGGIILSILFFVAIGLIIYFWTNKKLRNSYKKLLTTSTILVALAGFFLVLGIGSFSHLSPYAFLKHVPVFGDMRVSTRWFLWVTLLMLITVGFVTDKLLKNKRVRIMSVVAILAVVLELFATNFWYQRDVFSHTPTVAPHKVSSYQFAQIDQFGSKLTFDDGRIIPDDHKGPQFYREFEATTYNLGVVRANEALLNNRWQGLRCVEDSGCGMILSNNATIISWSPNKIILHRTAPGNIVLNVNASRYIKIDGKRTDTRKIVDTKQSVNISVPDSEATITLTYQPSYHLH